MVKIKLGAALTIALGIALLSAPVTEASSPVHGKQRSYYEERGDIVWEVPTQEKYIALTFDDGPDEQQTPKILELLEKYHAKATFFVVGDRVKRFPDIVKMEQAAGHEIGNHSYHHPSLHRLGLSALKEEMTMTQEAVLETTGRKPVLFRPPGGYYNDAIVELTKHHNLQMILWSWHQDTKDWTSPGVQRIVRKVLDNARNGDIILMHDYVYNSTQTIEALKVILPELQRRGYRFVTVSELLTHKVTTPDPQMKENH
ncbi:MULTISPECIES: polysaccharide deacetylase family protein [Paenibacillus]|jgi:polysaccharide deacetylase family sporulation protein PdaB|uniref:Polysaccharide deacetylase family sporulation protein PdaB n=1 Tax=Paenibacillus barengoltzii J12 TaxID=935846 RepID=A0ABY1M3N4_9BACL|nr:MULTISPECIES: polysaccharide deacetylase family protein [Paenibacillus]SMF70405.1 polysaccharide deacetylase family sporulation protein PdaB [Paenibacillus barengoltzii J12]